jgi:hypothetical protein
MMLGYTPKNLVSMRTSLQAVIKRTPEGKVKENLEMADDFLGGLWAEGYFDHD